MIGRVVGVVSRCLPNQREAPLILGPGRHSGNPPARSCRRLPDAALAGGPVRTRGTGSVRLVAAPVEWRDRTTSHHFSAAARDGRGPTSWMFRVGHARGTGPFAAALRGRPRDARRLIQCATFGRTWLTSPARPVSAGSARCARPPQTPARAPLLHYGCWRATTSAGPGALAHVAATPLREHPSSGCGAVRVVRVTPVRCRAPDAGC